MKMVDDVFKVFVMKKDNYTKIAWILALIIFSVNTILERGVFSTFFSISLILVTVFYLFYGYKKQYVSKKYFLVFTIVAIFGIALMLLIMKC